MKNTKRVLALLLTVAVMASCFVANVFAAETTPANAFSDVADDAIYATAVKAFNQMGIIKGYEDGAFRPDQNVTRAEFTAMLMRALNYGSLGSTSPEKLPFSDVKESDTSNSWAIPNINTAYGMGIINGYEDGTFRPGANVAYEEAIKMIVCTLGYTGIDVSGTPWYGQYLAQADRLGVTEYASKLGVAGTPASRACIAQMLYDSLEVPLVEQGNLTQKTILTDYLGYIKSVGVISSDGITSTTSADVNLRADEVQITGKEPDGSYATYTYKTTDPTLKNYLGYEMEYYYKKDSGTIRTLMLYVLQQNETITLNSDMIDEDASTNTQIKYYESEDDKRANSVSLASENVVILNGKLIGANETSSRFNINMIPQVGSITLLDSNLDGKYDLVKIEEYEIYYVSEKLSIDKSIIDNVTRTNAKLILDIDNSDGNLVIVDVDGKERDYSSINTGSIICFAESSKTNGGEVLQKAVVVNNNVTGTVTGLERDEAVTINGTRYKYSKAAPWVSGTGSLEEPALQDQGVYSLDINGDIVAYKKDVKAEKLLYAYIMGITDESSAFKDEKLIRLVNQEGNKMDIRLQDDVRINGERCTVDRAIEALTESANRQNYDEGRKEFSIQQLIKYTTKNSGGKTVLDKIYTVTKDTEIESGVDVASDKLYFYTPVKGNMSMNYNDSSKKLTSTEGSESVGIGSAIVFVVPHNRSYHANYKKSSVSTVFKDNKSNPEYYVEAFDVTETGKAKVVVCYGQNATAPVDSSSAVNIVTEDLKYENNPSVGENMYYMTGFASSYSNTKGSMAGWRAKSSDYKPQIGDIFRAGTDSYGYMKVLEKNLIYSVDGENTFGIKKEPTDEDLYDAEYAVILGSVIATDDTSISILADHIEKGEEANVNDAINFEFSQISGARVLYYNETGKELVIDDVSSEYQSVLKSLTGYKKDLTNPSKVLVYMSKGKICMFCVLGADA